MPTAPGAAEDEPVGVVLARMRRAKRLTGAKLASMVSMSQPKISRIERGKGLLDPDDVGVIARALGAQESDVQALMARAERLHDRMTDWRPAASAGLADRQKALMDWESAASVVRAFEPSLVPGPLQTSGYAKLIIQKFRDVAPASTGVLTESALLAAVSARVRRQEALARLSTSFQFVLGEAALKRRLFPPVEMLAQIAHLRDVATRSTNVRISIIPDDAPVAIPLLHGFFLYDGELVVIDLYNTGLISRSQSDVETYQRIFDALDEQAVDIGPMLALYEDKYIDMLRSSRDS